MASRTWKETVPAVPGVGVSMLPKVICPICSPGHSAQDSYLPMPSSRIGRNEVKE